MAQQNRNVIQVKDHPSLVRDVYSKAIINTDVSAYNAVCHRRNAQLKHETTITDLYCQIEELNNQIDRLLEWKVSVTEQLESFVIPTTLVKSKSKSTSKLV